MPSRSEPSSVQISTISMVLKRMPPRFSMSLPPRSPLSVSSAAHSIAHYTSNRAMLASAIGAQRYGLDLYQRVARQLGHGHSRARGRVAGKVLGVDLVHRAEVAHGSQEYRGFD